MEQSQRRIVACIPLRAGSKQIPMKNIRELAGRPLAWWVLDAVCGCHAIDTVYVMTDSSLIARVIGEYGNKKVSVIGRSPETATDTASTESALIEFARNHDCTDIVLVQATSPLLEEEHVTKALDHYITSGADSLLTVVRQQRFVWKDAGNGFVKPQNYNPLHRPRRQDWEGMLVENGALYITSAKKLLKTRSRISGRVTCYEMPEWTYHELDTETDWTIAETLLLQNKKRRMRMQQGRTILKKIKLLVMDVDGVLTDAGMYYGETGEELKKFNTKDGKGIELLRELGIQTAFLTSETTSLVEKRGRKLKIDFILQGVKNKAEALQDIMKQNALTPEEIAYIGDDVHDTKAMMLAGFSATPADGMEQNKKIASYICEKNGGEGCVREVCDLIRGAKQ
ncbi:MAG: HAD hydrolase family protein [Nitrospirota bacterium]